MHLKSQMLKSQSGHITTSYPSQALAGHQDIKGTAFHSLLSEGAAGARTAFQNTSTQLLSCGRAVSFIFFALPHLLSKHLQ